MFQLYIAAFDSEKMTGMPVPVHYQEWQASVGNLNDVVRFLVPGHQLQATTPTLRSLEPRHARQQVDLSPRPAQLWYRASEKHLAACTFRPVRAS